MFLSHVFIAMVLAANPPIAASQITVPPGFVVELVAGPPLVEHPTMAGFDDQGRLYVCDGPGLNLPAKELLRDLPNRIVRLDDSDGDGKFDLRTEFADKMTFPMGALWHRGAVYTASPPHIWRLRDKDGDGVADERTILVSEFGFTGNAADIHGCFLGPEGRLYWCDGRHGHNFIDEQGNQISKGLAARLFSCKLDGSNVETFAGGGMDNPVEVTFTEQGEPLGTVAIFDIVDGRHDALVHWVQGGAYPRYEQKCVGEFKRTGGLLPPVSRFLGVAPSGVTRYRGGQFGPEFRDNIFLVQFNTHTVTRTKLTRDGASFRSTDEDFLVSTSQDFHPTDVLEDADGSLLVIDTGGWFRIGCPTSQVAKPEILGGIYRIRRADAKPIADARGLTSDWDSVDVSALVERLADERPAVRERAMAALTGHGEAAVPALKAASHGRIDAAWTLARIDTPSARAALRGLLADKVADIRQVAARALGTARDKDSQPALLKLVTNDEPRVRREAASALGRIGDKSAVPAILEALRSPADRFLEHALIYALIELNDRDATAMGLADVSPRTRRGALVALDQMNDGRLARDEVAPLLETTDVALQQAALEVIQRHDGWSAECLPLLGRWLGDPQPSAERLAALEQALLAFCRQADAQQLVTDALTDDATSRATRVLLIELMARAEVSELPATWLAQLTTHLQARDAKVAAAAVSTVSARGGKQFDSQLQQLADDASRSDDLRLSALVVLGKHGQPLDAAGFQRLAARLDESVAPLDRLAAAEALGAAQLSATQIESLASHIAQAGPVELPALLRAFEKSKDVALAKHLIASLLQSPGVENLNVERIRTLFAGHSTDVLTAAEPLFKRLSVDVEQQRARLAELSAALEGGDAKRGKAVFMNQKFACTGCHRVGTDGALIGPDLTKVGQIRAPLDLLESVVFPSNSFARGYESYAVVTDAGQVVTGILARETTESVYLRTAQKEEVRIARSSIESLAPSKVSIMPQGLDKLLSPAELRDLMAFLRSLK